MGATTTWIRWAGVDRNGNHRTGFAGADDVAEWVRLHFNAGWKRLVVRTEGREIGGIDKSAGRRTWWADRQATTSEGATDV